MSCLKTIYNYIENLLAKSFGLQRYGQYSKLIFNNNNIENYEYDDTDEYKIVSLGCDCAVRRYLTLGGLKKTKRDGELSMPFDLCYIPMKSLKKILSNNFSDYFNNLYYKDWGKSNFWKNGKYNIRYNHDKDCGKQDYEKFIKRFIARIVNFELTLKHAPFIFFVIKSSQSYKEQKDLFNILKRKRKNKPFVLIVLDTNCRIKGKDSNNDIKILKLHHPFPKEGDWWRDEYIRSAESINFQKQICEFVKDVIKTQGFALQICCKTDENNELGEY